MSEIKTVLCPVDFSTVSDWELQLAIQICERVGARLVLHHNIDYVPEVFLATGWMYSETHRHSEEEKEAKTEAEFQKIFAKIPSSIKVEAKITRGHLDDSILYVARGLPADLIVMGTHGPTHAEHVSHTDRVLVHSPCPVLTTRDSGPEMMFPNLRAEAGQPQPVLVPMDFSSHSLHALEYALSLMDTLPLKLHLFHVEKPMALEDIRGVARLDLEGQRDHRLQHALERLKALIPAEFMSRADFQVRMGAVVDEIIGYAKSIQATLVIMGAHPKNVFDKLLFGATSCGVLHKSPCPVWIVPVNRSEGRSGAWIKTAAAGHDSTGKGVGPENFIG